MRIVPTDGAGHYDQMFWLKFIRIVERVGRHVEIEHPDQLSKQQQCYPSLRVWKPQPHLRV